ncbi:MAG: glycosidase [Spirochaetes bacterium]|nr:MAG: glycosidase [Spirochaetota bacterium]
MIKLKRITDQPILSPDPVNSWEAGAVFNCAAIYDNGLVHMIYRATDIAPNGKEGKYINRLGYAVSKDGIHFNKLKYPVLSNNDPHESRGAEDPRVVKLNGTFYMMYTGYNGRVPGDYRICLASSRNLKDWRRHGIVLHEKNKNASLFPEKVSGRYVMFHRRDPDIWIAYSNDLETFYDHKIVMKPLPGSNWEDKKIGIAGPPLKTEEGWLLIYHGVSSSNVYSLGIALLDLDNPSIVLARQSEPILYPELEWEIHGHVPNVVFSCGHAEIGERILVYYCGADTVIGVAELCKKEIWFK